MAMIVFPTKFNKTGRRVLTTPLKEKWVCAPAKRRYRKACDVIKSEWKLRLDEARRRYTETMLVLIASYVAGSSTSKEQKHMIISFLIEESSIGTAAMDVDVPRRWSKKLRNITGLDQAAEEASRIYEETRDRVFREWDEALGRAHDEYDAMKRTLWRECSDHIHHEYHVEDA